MDEMQRSTIRPWDSGNKDLGFLSNLQAKEEQRDEKLHPCVCISSAFLLCKVGGKGASSAQVELATVSTLLSSFANLCPYTAPGWKTGLDKVA